MVFNARAILIPGITIRYTLVRLASIMAGICKDVAARFIQRKRFPMAKAT